MTSITRWSIPFDYNQIVEDLTVAGMRDWNTIHGLEDLSELSKFAEDVRQGADWMREMNFNPETCRGVMEMWIEPPADTFGSGWKDVQAYDGIYTTLVKLTELGYDVRPKWREFRSSMLKIWQSLPDFFQGQRVAEDIGHKRVMEAIASQKPWETPDSYKQYVVDEHKKLYEKTELPPDYDPNKPFPQYPIPADIDDDVKEN